MLPPLTKRQKEILDFINISIKTNGYAPSLQEIKVHFKLKAVSTVHEHLENLKNKGYIKKEMNQARGIQIQKNINSKEFIKVQIKGQVQSGEVVFVYSNNQTFALDSKIRGLTSKCYLLIAEDNALEHCGIKKGDRLIVSPKTNESNTVLIKERTATKIKTRNSSNDKNVVGGVISLVREMF